MQKKQQQVGASFHRVTQFLRALPPATDVRDLTAPLAEFSAIAAALSAHAVPQNAGRRGSRGNTRKAAALVTRALALETAAQPYATLFV